MNNPNSPAFPVPLQEGESLKDGLCPLGLTKREFLAATINVAHDEITITDQDQIEEFIGRRVDLTDFTGLVQAACEIDARYRVMKADALLAALARTA